MNYLQTLARWQELKITIANLQTEERALRDGIFSGTFPSPKEGVNKVKLPDGRELKGTYKINRSLDQEAVHTLPLVLRKLVIRTKHDLIVPEYKKLSPADRKVVDKVLTAKPGLPTLEIKDAKTAPVDVKP